MSELDLASDTRQHRQEAGELMARFPYAWAFDLLPVVAQGPFPSLAAWAEFKRGELMTDAGDELQLLVAKRIGEQAANQEAPMAMLSSCPKIQSAVHERLRILLFDYVHTLVEQTPGDAFLMDNGELIDPEFYVPQPSEEGDS